MKKKYLLWPLVLVVSVSIVVTLSFVGCKTTTTTETTAAETTTVETTAAVTTAAEEPIKIGYVSKLLSHEWFTAEQVGMQKFCDEVGAELIAVDANMDDEKCVQLVDELITKGIDGLLITVTSEGIGPAVTKKAEEAGIPIMTLDDYITDHNGNRVPHVGIPAYGLGYDGGVALAQLAEERGFFKEGNIVKVLNVTITKLGTVWDRTNGYTDAFTEKTALVNPDDFILADTETGFMDEALTAVSAVVSAHPEVTHWIAAGINDDTAIAAVRIFEELGISRDNYLSCGIGAYGVGIEELDKGNRSFVTLKLQPEKEGYTIAEHMYNYLAKGIPLPANTEVGGTLVTVDNYKE